MKRSLERKKKKDSKAALLQNKAAEIDVYLERFVCCQVKSLRLADLSSRGVLPNVVCVCFTECD